jgi:predicted DCC family thiol-disulfide oxidoreductase YuxK
MDKGIIIFDGYCNFCSRSVHFIIKRDRKRYFTFAASQTGEGQNIIARYCLGEMAEHSIVLIENEKVYRKSTAALKIARQLGKGWQLIYVCMIIPPVLRDLIYDLVARSRYRLFGKSERCFVPEPAIRERFLGEE